MKKYDARVEISASATDVLSLMTTAEYAKDEAILDGAVKAEARVKEKTDEKVVIVVDREDPSRGPGGKVANKTEKNIITQEWNLSEMKCRWSVRVPGMEKMVKISGISWIEKKGESECEYKESGSVDIKVPVIGKIIASGVVSDIKKDFPKKKKYIENNLK